MIYALINYLSNNKKGSLALQSLKSIYKDLEIQERDITKLQVKDFFASINEDDVVVICGGDGTLSRFANSIDVSTIRQKLYLLPCGSGNDFAKDVKDYIKAEDGLIPLNNILMNLPTVTVNEKEYKFINGVGFGLDGYVCEEGDKVRDISDKPVNYTNIAINGLLFNYKPRDANVTVDGRTFCYEKVWLAPTMLGKFYGGGMMITPDQNRLNSEHTVTFAVWKNTGKIGTLTKFNTIFSGDHIKYEKNYEAISGHEITVEYSEPTPLQIDGETIRDVDSYTVKFH